MKSHALIDPTLSRNHDAVLSAKLNQLCLDGNLNNSACFALVAVVVDTGDEFTKRPGSLRGIIFHNLEHRREDRFDVMGCLPHPQFGKFGLV